MKKIFFIIIFLPIFYAKAGWATCSLSSGTRIVTMPLQVSNLNVGPDVANGTTILNQTVNSKYSNTVTCDASGPFIMSYSYTSLPLPLNSWSSGVAAGKVYETGIPGIGFYAWQGSQPGTATFPGTKDLGSANPPCAVGTKCNISTNYFQFDIRLIKTGPISSGTIQGSNLPCPAMSIGQVGNTPMVVNVCISGAINIVSNTCATPDVNVSMGTHDAAEFAGVGTATNWVDSSITLTNCPVFNGTATGANWSLDGTQTSGQGSITMNPLNLALTPGTFIINSSTGVFGLTQSSATAAGIGIQLAYGTSNSPTLVNFSSARNYIQAVGTSGTVILPLVARYIQTTGAFSPGKANGTVIFVINYN